MRELMPWDDRFMALAKFWAALCSKDPSTQVGAVLVGADRRNIALGYNGFPPEINDHPDRMINKEVKYKLTQHAERNVLDNAKFETYGSTIYCTMFPCSECAKSMVSKGVKRVVCPGPVNREPWREDSTWALLILQEGDVTITKWSSGSE